MVSQLEAAKAEAAASGKTGFNAAVAVAVQSYSYSKFVREDNYLVDAKYLGYLNTRELYPDFKPINFEQEECLIRPIICTSIKLQLLDARPFGRLRGRPSNTKALLGI